MLGKEGFDIWSEEYDKYIQKTSKGYPFEGYYDTLNYVYGLIKVKELTRILDIRFGTGFLTDQLYKDGAKIYGIDFSQKMIEISQEKMPKAKLIQWDFNFGLPIEFEKEIFDYIISTYAIHHLNNDKKIEFIKKLKRVLNNNGKIIIADIAFNTKKEFLECQRISIDRWDKDEIYIIADEFIGRLLEERIVASYKQISSCAGVVVIS